MTVSRRNFMKLFGVGAASLGVGSLALPKLAVGAQSRSGFAAVYRFNLGDFELTAIQDGRTRFDTSFMAANAPEEAAGVLASLNLQPDQAFASYNLLLVNTGDQLILMDTGNGAAAGGLLLPAFELIGIPASDINAVVISHFHPDHVNGLATASGAVFPNATVYYPEPEYGFMQGGPYGNDTVDSLITAANNMLAPYMAAEKFEVYGDGAELAPGIQTVYTPGHSPGHMSFLLTSSSETLLCSVDTAIHAVLSVGHPEYNMSFDADPQLAVDTRRAILQRASDEKLRVFGYHFPFPGLGYIAPEGDGYRFSPEA